MSNFVADIGGTHARIAVLERQPAGYNLANPQKFECAAFGGLAECLDAYCLQTGYYQAGGDILISAAANPGSDGIWRFLNRNSWTLDVADMARRGWKLRKIVNDFLASARGAIEPGTKTDVVMPGKGAPPANAARVLLGPGTGLGLAFMFPLADSGCWHIAPTHGGHMLGACLTDEQRAVADIIVRLRGGGTPFIPEDAVSGRGFPFLYRALCELSDKQAQENVAQSVIDFPQDEMAAHALRLFHEFLGLFAHNCVVTASAYGGIYLDGGVVQTLYERKMFDVLTFARFLMPGMVHAVQRDLETVPVNIVRDPFIALRGLAAMMQEFDCE